jgi:hypothetical protein
MRRAISATAVLVVALGILVGFGLGAGCSHDARPAGPPTAQPDDHPPLPPASGTPIGYLVDNASGLSLRDDQLTKLKAIDDDLALKLAYLDGILRSAAPGPTPDKEDSRGGIGFTATGENNGQGSGLTSTPPPGTQVVGGNGPQPGAKEENAEIVKRVPEVRAHDVRTAIAHALALLDPPQQKLARQLLKDRGIDPDTGKTEASGEPGPGRSRGSN